MDNYNYYFCEELIDILKKKDRSLLWFYEQCNGKLGTNTYIYINDKADDVELHIHAPDNMMDETIDRVIDVLEHLEECIQRAYVWLSKQNLHDEWFTKPYYSPQELAQLFTLDVLDFREAGSEPGSPDPTGGVFVMTFCWIGYLWLYDVCFHYDDLQPYKSEKYLW